MERIYLHTEGNDTTWVEHRIDESDVEYIRADVAVQAPCETWEPNSTRGPLTAAQLIAVACSTLNAAVAMGALPPFAAMEVLQRVEDTFGTEEHDHKGLVAKTQHLLKSGEKVDGPPFVAIVDAAALLESN